MYRKHFKTYKIQKYQDIKKVIKLMKTKYCLQSSVSFNQINHSHLNLSKSKQTFSFCKSPRFETIQPYCKRNTYNGDSIQRKNSGFSVGKGKRSDFTKSQAISPGVSKYNLKTLFEPKQIKTKGYTLRLSRQKVNFGDYLNKEVIAVPAPTRYNTQKKQRIRSPSYSLRPKTKILDKTRTIQPQNSNPGPGYYENPQISQNSKYASKFSNIGYSNSKSKRFGSDDNKVPGPGNYKEISSLSKVGKYVLSNNIGGTKAIFDHSKRVSKFEQAKNNASGKPGPGFYRLPSEFGQYDGDIYPNQRTVRTSRYTKRTDSKRD